MLNYKGTALTAKARDKKYEVKTTITGDVIENIVVTAIEGGISYWGAVDTSTEEFKLMEDQDLPLSQKVVEILLTGGSVKLVDIEEDEETKFPLSLERLLIGVSNNAMERPHDCNLENLDSITADSIIQYAVFGEIVFS